LASGSIARRAEAFTPEQFAELYDIIRVDAMRARMLGNNGPAVSAIVLRWACRTLRPGGPRESFATIQPALDAGVTLIDTADFHGPGHNKLLIRDALRTRNRERRRAVH
jgi:aryl-alcohol dehydrogenase-like predicted oxidoreductase